MKMKQTCRKCGKVFYCDGICEENHNNCECAKCFMEVETYEEAVKEAIRRHYDVCEIRCNRLNLDKEKVTFT